MSNNVKMEKDSEWVNLGSDIEFTAKLQNVGGGVSLFSKEPSKGAAVADGVSEEYLLTLEGKAHVENLPWLKQVRGGLGSAKRWSLGCVNSLKRRDPPSAKKMIAGTAAAMTPPAASLSKNLTSRISDEATRGFMTPPNENLI